MTLKERLEKKVQDYCVKAQMPLMEGSLGYVGLNSGARSPSGEVRAMHVVAFNTWA